MFTVWDFRCSDWDVRPRQSTLPSPDGDHRPCLKNLIGVRYGYHPNPRGTKGACMCVHGTPWACGWWNGVETAFAPPTRLAIPAIGSRDGFSAPGPPVCHEGGVWNAGRGRRLDDGPQ